jgi:MFS family permease
MMADTAHGESRELLPKEPPRTVGTAGSLEALGTTPARFLELAVYASACFLAAVGWNTVVPVYALAESRFGVGPQRLNSLSNARNIFGAPGALFALWFTERHGLRHSLLWGYGSQLVCAALAAFAFLPVLPGRWTFLLLYVSQVLSALTQPLYTNNITLLVGEWFPAQERDSAVALALLALSVGSVFVGLYAPMAVHAPHQMWRLYCWQVPAWALVGAAGVLFTEEQPPAPPSVAAALARAARREAVAEVATSPANTSTHNNAAALRAIGAHVVELLRNINFVLLMLSSSLLTALVGAMLTVIGQLIPPCGGSDTETGAALAAAAAGSGVAVVGYIVAMSGAGQADMPATPPTPRPYRLLQFAATGATVAGVALVLASLRAGTSATEVVASWASFGLLSGTLLNGALTMEHAVELSFPVPPNLSVASLTVAASLMAFLEVPAATALLAAPLSTTCASRRTPFAAFCAANAAFSMMFLVVLRPDYKRTTAEASVLAAHGGPGGGGSGNSTDTMRRGEGGDYGALA